MDGWIIAIILQPIALLIVITLLIPVRMFIFRRFPNGKLKRLLLTPVKGYPGSDAWKRRLDQSVIDRPGHK